MFRAPHLFSVWEWFHLRMKSYANFSQALQEEPSLRNRYVRGTLCFLPQVEWTTRCPDSKQGRVSLQWLKCRLIFHLTRWRDDRIPCGDSRVSHSPPPLLDRGPHILLTHREMRWVHWFKRWHWLFTNSLLSSDLSFYSLLCNCY